MRTCSGIMVTTTKKMVIAFIGNSELRHSDPVLSDVVIRSHLRGSSEGSGLGERSIRRVLTLKDGMGRED